MFINRSAYEEFPVVDSRKLYFQLFNSRQGDCFQDFDTWKRRYFDLAFVGGGDSHRNQTLAKNGHQLSRLNCSLHVPLTPEKANSIPDLSQLSSESFHDLVAESLATLNVHRKGTKSFEWPRLLTCMEAGSAVITESSIDCDGMIPNRDFLELNENLDIVVLFQDLDRIYKIAKNAFENSISLRDKNSINHINTFLKSSFSLKQLLVPSLLRYPKLTLRSFFY
jgi:hypothetical protein